MFIIIVVIAGKQLVNILPSPSYENLYDENVYLSTTLLQPGYPSDWTPGNVLIPGIASNNRMDETKLANFDTFTYDETKSFFHIASEYLFYFKNDTGIVPLVGECNFGFAVPTNMTTCEPDITSLGYANLVKTSRIVIYKSDVIEMVLYSWN